jgi:hypothetical protein
LCHRVLSSLVGDAQQVVAAESQRLATVWYFIGRPAVGFG